MLNFGVSFAGVAGDTMFNEAEDPDGGNAEFLRGFLYQPTFGMKFDSTFGLSAGLMIGIRNYKGTTANENGAKGTPKSIFGHHHFYAMVMHASAAFDFGFGLTIKGDIAALIDFQDGKRVKNDKGTFGLERNTAFYYGVGVDLALGDLAAGLSFTSKDKTIDQNVVYDGLTYGGTEEAYAYQHGMKLTLGYNDGGKGFGAGAYLGIADFSDVKGNLTAGVNVGYLGLEFGKFEFGTTVAFDLSPDSDDDYHGTDWIYGFLIKPVLSWKLISHGSIDFTYSFGATNLMYKLDINTLGIAFKWKF
jgi:hypothetical protein